MSRGLGDVYKRQYLKMVKRVNLLNDKIDFLKAKFDDLQKQISENKQKQKDS